MSRRIAADRIVLHAFESHGYLCETAEILFAPLNDTGRTELLRLLSPLDNAANGPDAPDQTAPETPD